MGTPDETAIFTEARKKTLKRLAEQGYVVAEGPHYLSVVELLLRNLDPEWYLEIGAKTGASLRVSRAKSVSVEPAHSLHSLNFGDKPELHVFRETSDAFFAAGRLEKLGALVDLVLLDGRSRFEALLQDFISAEKTARSEGVIVFGGCLPQSASMASRHPGTGEPEHPVGDIWKLLPILQNYRPDLQIEVADAAPAGLAIVSGLDPGNGVLSQNYAEIVERFQGVTLPQFGVGRYFGDLDVQTVEESRWASAFPRELGSGWQSNPDIAIKIAAPDRSKITGWGDYHFARGLARAFSRLGHRASIDAKENWYDNKKPGGIDLVIRGRAHFNRQPGRASLFWNISKGMRQMNYSQADHVLWASNTLFEEAKAARGHASSTLLPQASDADLMKPGDSGRREGIVFVGRNRSTAERRSVAFALAADEDVKIWGPGWRGGEYSKFVVADGVPNTDLPEIYRSAEIVLNDHTPVMRSRGLLSNRVFDTLACGAIPVSEDVGWLPEDIAEFVYVFHDQDSFEHAIARARAEPPEMRERRDRLARHIATTHSFDARAKEILAIARGMAGPEETGAT